MSQDEDKRPRSIMEQPRPDPRVRPKSAQRIPLSDEELIQSVTEDPSRAYSRGSREALEALRGPVAAARAEQASG